MARILVLEPSTEVRELLGRIVEQLGHVALTHEDFVDETTLEVDAVLLEPGFPGALERMQALRARRPGLPIVCVSIYPQGEEIAALAPLSYLLKPFPLAVVSSAVEAAVAAPEPGAVLY